METRAGEYEIKFMSEMLKVSRSGYYKYLESKRKPKKNTILSAVVEEILGEDEENTNYGKVRLRDALHARGYRCSRDRMGEIMREMGLIHTKKRKPNSITKADKEAQASENLLKRDFSAEKPNEKYVTDITEVSTADGKLYVSAIFDCYDNTAWGLEMDDNMRKELVCKSMESAVKTNPLMRGAIIHSDRGSQYTSGKFRETLGKFGINQSMNSAGGRCHDNAKCESMWARLKEEKLYKVDTSKMPMSEIKSMIWRYFYSYWNNRRICSAIGGMPPMIKRQQYFNSLKSAV